MLRAVCLSACAWLIAAAALAAPPIKGDVGATYDDLIREQTLVTIVLKGGARDANLRIKDIHEKTIEIVDATGQVSAYPLDFVQEVRVQRGQVASTRATDIANTLTSDDQIIVRAAEERAYEIFSSAQDDQGLKMTAAMVLAASEHERKQNAMLYLGELAEQNDIPTAMAAALYLWAVGNPPGDDLIREGFLSGNRNARASACALVGLMGRDAFLGEVRSLLGDPAIEVFPHAAKAAGRLGDRRSLDVMYDAILALNDVKAEAAIFALKEIGGADVRQRLLDMKERERGMEWFRIIRVLYALGDAQAKRILIEDALRQPAYQQLAAILLARDGELAGIEWLRDYLDKPEDPNLENLVYRAAVGVTLWEVGDLQARGVLQELLETQPREIYARGRTTDQNYKQQAAQAVHQATCAMIGDTLDRRLLRLLQAPVQSQTRQTALGACSAVVQIANRDFGERLKELRE